MATFNLASTIVISIIGVTIVVNDMDGVVVFYVVGDAFAAIVD